MNILRASRSWAAFKGDTHEISLGVTEDPLSGILVLVGPPVKLSNGIPNLLARFPRGSESGSSSVLSRTAGLGAAVDNAACGLE